MHQLPHTAIHYLNAAHLHAYTLLFIAKPTPPLTIWLPDSPNLLLSTISSVAASHFPVYLLLSHPLTLPSQQYAYTITMYARPLISLSSPPSLTSTRAPTPVFHLLPLVLTP